jgi:hypothetical protein
LSAKAFVASAVEPIRKAASAAQVVRVIMDFLRA